MRRRAAGRGFPSTVDIIAGEPLPAEHATPEILHARVAALLHAAPKAP
jgi:hypothetical protein